MSFVVASADWTNSVLSFNISVVYLPSPRGPRGTKLLFDNGGNPVSQDTMMRRGERNLSGSFIRFGAVAITFITSIF